MGAKRIPNDAFDAYVSLGPDRSYAAIAKRLGVTKRGIVAKAKREDWQSRLNAIEAKARQAADARASETIEAMQERHLKIYKAVQGKALEALRTMPLESAWEAVRALEVGIEGERLARGEPTERAAVDIVTVIKKEYQNLLLKPGETDDWGDAGQVTA